MFQGTIQYRDLDGVLSQMSPCRNVLEVLSRNLTKLEYEETKHGSREEKNGARSHQLS